MKLQRAKMLTTAAGPMGTFLAGMEYDLPEGFANSLFAGGYAIPVKGKPAPVEAEALPEPEIEMAVQEPQAEKAVGKPMRRKAAK
jgi:hypothetical protein